MSVRVLLVDDQELMRTGFRMILEANEGIEVVAEAGDGYEAVDAALRSRPDVVLMDIRMPRMNGVEATRRIIRARTAKPVRVLILTTFDLDEYVYSALRAGASGFLIKDAPADQLVHAIRTVAAGDGLLAPAITRRLIAEFARRPRPDDRPDIPLDELTERELDVLKLIAKGLTNAEIAAHLVVAETTVKTHVGNVLGKLGLRHRVQAVVAAYETGLIAPGADSPPDGRT